MLTLILEERGFRGCDTRQVVKAGPGPLPFAHGQILFSASSCLLGPFLPLPTSLITEAPVLPCPSPPPHACLQLLLPSLPTPFSVELSGVVDSVPTSSAPISLPLPLANARNILAGTKPLS